MSDVFGPMGSALTSKLAAGAALITLLGGTAIYNTLAPQGSVPPYVIFTFTSGADDNSSPRRARTNLITAKAVTTEQAQAENIDAQLDALLHEATLTITGWGNYRTTRTTDIAYEQMAGNVIYWHRGARYRVRIAE